MCWSGQTIHQWSLTGIIREGCSRPLCRLARLILLWAHNKFLFIRVIHVPGHLNLWSDLLEARAEARRIEVASLTWWAWYGRDSVEWILYFCDKIVLHCNEINSTLSYWKKSVISPAMGITGAVLSWSGSVFCSFLFSFWTRLCTGLYDNRIDSINLDVDFTNILYSYFCNILTTPNPPQKSNC